VLGSVPAIGDLFDAAWKANIKNVALLERHLVAGTAADREKRGVAGAIVLAVIVLVVILATGLALGIFAVRLLWGLWTR
jgi:hypothetical protein